jgi:ABC-2 type transport system permease protein
MTETAELRHRTGPGPHDDVGPGRGASAQRPSAWSLVWGQIAHASRDAWRTPVSMVVTLGLPVLFLVLTGLVAGASPGAASDPMIQRLVPGAAVFAIAMAAFVMLAYAIALAAEQGVLKRLRGTPLPAWAYLAGRAGAAAWVALAGTILMVAVGILAYDLQVTPRLLPAAALGLMVTILTFATLGFALALLLRSAQAVMSAAMGSVVLLGFVSDLYGFSGDMPAGFAAIGWALPLRHAVEVLALPLQVDASGSGIAGTSLVALLAWGVLGGLAAAWAVGRDGRSTGGQRAGRRSAARGGTFAYGSDRPAGMVWGQVRYANRGIWREPVFAGFALVMPTMFVVILPQVVGDPIIDGVAFSTSMVTGMLVFGVALTAYVALPEMVAVARDRGILKRLRGTPLPAWAYLVGRILSVFWITSITIAIVLTAGWLLYGSTPIAAGWPAFILTVVIGVACFASLGMAIAALVPNADTVPAVALATFLPLVFLSGIFPLGDTLPDLIPAIAAWLPVAPLVDSVREAFATGGLLVRELTVVVAWTVLGATVALARFRWQ